MKSEITGQKFGRLVAEWPVGRDHGEAWLFMCSCGNLRVLSTRLVTHGNTRSCGCLQRDQIIARNKTHGLSGTPTHKAWKAMRWRVSPANPDHRNYAGRGITVCERWNDYRNFLADMGSKPSPDYSLDRIDNSGNYEPSNCRWATRSQQMGNTKRAILLTPNGKTQSASAWAREIGRARITILERLEKGMPMEMVLSGSKFTGRKLPN